MYVSNCCYQIRIPIRLNVCFDSFILSLTKGSVEAFFDIAQDGAGMMREWEAKLYDGDAGIACVGPILGASPHTPLRFASGAQSETGDLRPPRKQGTTQFRAIRRSK